MLRVLKHPRLIGVFLFGGFLILLGVSLFMTIEGWSAVDALYFTVATMTTVGYGDITPVTELGKIVAVLYMLAIVPTVIVALSIVADLVYKRK